MINVKSSLLEDGKVVIMDENKLDIKIDANEQQSKESFADFCKRQMRNVLCFLVEDWCLSAMLGIITAILSVVMDICIEKLQHSHVAFYEALRIHWYHYLALLHWLLHIVLLTFLSAASCLWISKQAIGSGIPEVKVIMHGFKMENYLTVQTLIAKMIGLTLAIGSGLPIGKEGPFVHMAAIVATILSKVTTSCHYTEFFANEGREMEMLSSGCAVGIACTFSAPVGAVLYAIESTSKYFAVKNYWRGFLAATCSAIVFRFANFFVTAEQSGTIMAFYQTNFPTESFLVEELPIFAFLGLLGGLFAALFIFTHRKITLFRQDNSIYRMIFRKNFFAFTVFMALVVGILTYPEGFGRYIAGQLTFRETMADFFNNCTMHITNTSKQPCSKKLLQHWTSVSSESQITIFHSLTCYLITYFFLVAICISINVPAGVFVPSFVIGAAGGRLTGEVMAFFFPEGLRGPNGPPIFPGLYAVVGAAAYTGAVTHTLSVAVIICELTGQLTPLLPVLIAMLVGNAVCKFLQPSIYESIIRIKKYPYLPDLPPSRISVHTVKVEQIMVKDIIYITKSTTYRELREILRFAPTLKSFPVVTDRKYKILLGSVAKKYLAVMMRRQLIDAEFNPFSNKRTPAEIFNSIKRSSLRLSKRQRSQSNGGNSAASLVPDAKENLPDEGSITGNTLLSISPLHAPHDLPLSAIFVKPTADELKRRAKVSKDNLLDQVIDLDEVAIDSAPFQLVLGSSLYKVHTLFSLLALSHAYVTDRGRLIGVIALKELRDALANIYIRGAVPVNSERKLTSFLS
uniref:CBS domain-containing protein n=1 Tax=Wuchereria bancrofti TaxID=6293 RepID=A0AAF5PXW5_WUCBA